jgi:hypothetical protein
MMIDDNSKQKIVSERIRQAHQSFNLAFAGIALGVVISSGGLFLVSSGKTAFGVFATAFGLVPISKCIKLYDQANNRLDELAGFSDDQASSDDDSKDDEGCES